MNKEKEESSGAVGGNEYQYFNSSSETVGTPNQFDSLQKFPQSSSCKVTDAYYNKYYRPPLSLSKVLGSTLDPCYELRVLLYSLSRKLSIKESDTLITNERLPTRLRGEEPFDILMQLKIEGRFYLSKLDDLAKILKRINRDDLAEEVTKFAEKNEEAYTNHIEVCTTDAILEMILQLALLQYGNLTHQIELSRQAANKAGCTRVEQLICELKAANEHTNESLHSVFRIPIYR